MTAPVMPQNDEQERLQRIRSRVRQIRAKGQQLGKSDAEIQAGISAYMQTEQVKPEVESRQTGEQALAGGLRSVAQGLTFNFADELEAGLRALGPETYDEAKASINQNLQNFRAENPKSAFMLELGGGALSGGALAKGIGSGVKGVSQAAKLATTGAGAGALAGIGAGETWEDRLQKGAKGAVGGALLGAGANYVAKKLRPVVEKAEGRLAHRLSGVPNTAEFPESVSPLAEKLVAKGVQPAAIRTDMDDVPRATVVDALPEEGQRIARGIRTAGGAPAQTVNDAVNAGQAGQREAITDALTMGQGRESRVGTIDAIRERQRAAAKPLYDQAFGDKSPITDEGIAELLQRPGVKDLVNQYRRTEAIAGRKVPPVFADEAEDIASFAPKPPGTELVRRNTLPGTGEQPIDLVQTGVEKEPFGPTLEALDHVKRALDSGIESAFKGEAKDFGRGRALRELRGQLLDRVRTLGDEGNAAASAYGKARSSFAGDAAQLDAIDAGAAFMKRAGDYRDPEAIASAFKAMTPGEQELARKSASHEVLLYLDGANDNANLTERLANPDFRNRVAAVWQDDAQNVLSMLDKLRTKAAVRNFIQRGSPTVDKAIDVADVTGMGERAVERTISGGKGAAVTGAVQDAYNALRGKVGTANRQRMADALAAPLTKDELERLFAAMRRVEASRAPVRAAGVFGGEAASQFMKGQR